MGTLFYVETNEFDDKFVYFINSYSYIIKDSVRIEYFKPIKNNNNMYISHLLSAIYHQNGVYDYNCIKYIKPTHYIKTINKQKILSMFKYVNSII